MAGVAGWANFWLIALDSSLVMWAAVAGLAVQTWVQMGSVWLLCALMHSAVRDPRPHARGSKGSLW